MLISLEEENLYSNSRFMPSDYLKCLFCSLIVFAHLSMAFFAYSNSHIKSIFFRLALILSKSYSKCYFFSVGWVGWLVCHNFMEGGGKLHLHASNGALDLLATKLLSVSWKDG